MTDGESRPPTALDALAYTGSAHTGAEPGDSEPIEVAPFTITSLDVARPYDPTRARERMRGAIAIVLLSILGAVVLFAFIGLWTQSILIEDMRTLLEILFAPLVGLVGAVTGFYYGSRAGHD
jgi:hypothetical protein